MKSAPLLRQPESNYTQIARLTEGKKISPQITDGASEEDKIYPSKRVGGGGWPYIFIFLREKYSGFMLDFAFIPVISKLSKHVPPKIDYLNASQLVNKRS